MIKIGLTGGIASGKSEAAKHFVYLKVPVIDTDRIAKKLTAPDTPAYQAIIAHFGNSICSPDGEIDRVLLRKLIFTNHKERRWLEQLLHPLIYQQVLASLAKVKPKQLYTIIVVPLLFETKIEDFRKLMDKVLVLDVDRSAQIERLIKRDHCDDATAKKMLAAQTSRKRRLAKADYVIENMGTKVNLKREIRDLHSSIVADSIWPNGEFNIAEIVK